MAVSTAELIKNIRIAVDMGEFTAENRDEFLDESPHIYLNRKLTGKGLPMSEICALAGLDPSYCYRIVSGARTPGRNTLLRLAIGAGLSVDETQHALRLYGLARLDPRCYRDAAILFAISKLYTLVQATELLCELGEAEL